MSSTEISRLCFFTTGFVTAERKGPLSVTLLTPTELIVVEVVSPSSERDDTGEKLVEYFSVASIRHYLIVNPFRRVVIHHARDDAGTIVTRIMIDGTIDLTPPGMDVAVGDLLAGADDAGALGPAER